MTQSEQAERIQTTKSYISQRLRKKVFLNRQLLSRKLFVPLQARSCKLEKDEEAVISLSGAGADDADSRVHAYEP